jgi:Domain of unknown function (DUF4836)
MKRIILSFTICCLIAFSLQAQNFISKVPIHANTVIKYAGENFSKSMPLKKVDTYNFIKTTLLHSLNMDSLKSITELGIDFEQDTYQYITSEDSSMSFVTMLHVKNASQFETFIKAFYITEKEAVKKDGFQFLTASSGNYVGWNSNTAVIVSTSFSYRKNYYDYYETTNTVDSAASAATEATSDTAIYAPPTDAIKDNGDVIVEAPIEESKSIAVDEAKAPNPKKYNNLKDKKKPIKKKKSTTTKKRNTTTKSKKKPKAQRPQVIEETTVEMVEEVKSDYDLKRELWEQRQQTIADKKQEQVAEKIITAVFSNTTAENISNKIAYNKIVDAVAPVSVWFNAQNIASQYSKFLYGNMSYGLRDLGRSMPFLNFMNDTTGNFSNAVNVYFDNNKMRMEQKSFSTDETMNNLGKAIMNNKQNQSFTNYINPNNIGHFSISINTEAAINYYYTIAKKLFNGYANRNEKYDYTDIINLYIDLIEIMIDEKGISDLNTGNYLFVLHDMKTKLVKYTDYEYDKEYNSKPIEKTKKELSPNFSVIIETRKEAFMEKLMRLPLKYAEKDNIDYKDRGGYYELSFEKDKYPINSLYFLIKDGKAMMTTSKEVLDMALKNASYKINEDTKKSILNNNYSIKLDTKGLMDAIADQIDDKTNKKIAQYLKDNMGDFKVESAFKNGMVQGTTTMNVNGKHSNSLEFIFNMIEAINNIIVTENVEKEKVIN